MFKKLASAFKEAFAGKGITPEEAEESSRIFKKAMADIKEKGYYDRLDTINSILQIQNNPFETLDKAVELACKSQKLDDKAAHIDNMIDQFLAAPAGKKADVIEANLPGLFNYTEEQYQSYLQRYSEAVKRMPSLVDAECSELAQSDDPSKKCKLLIEIVCTAYIKSDASVPSDILANPGYVPKGSSTLQ